jgi:hypothetical protein
VSTNKVQKRYEVLTAVGASVLVLSWVLGSTYETTRRENPKATQHECSETSKGGGLDSPITIEPDGKKERIRTVFIMK